MSKPSISISDVVIMNTRHHSFPAKVINVTSSYMIVTPMSYIDPNHNPKTQIKVDLSVINLIRQKENPLYR